ncbi:alpha-1,3-galactosidase-related protein [Paenibacillus arenilitoris]|uniref:Right-handed parallel beta-helix repeat-containing protein n=1 Tax=Paenibacillus arenilitoris TaxID=2772299 RepID=A0A927H9B0_9BACL|nr:right-handed parallel beta-helix repeat-containing protein [Paenibacillus arenilitoris]MBD2872930.1 right-handed parallel beta-helix repeat-containing protein [Paenibacillus arenilitoris]
MTHETEHELLLAFADFGGRPDTAEDAGPAMRRALAAVAAAARPVRLAIEPGRYDFYAESAEKTIYFITNTASEQDNPNPVKTIGIRMKGLKNFTLDGGGALFLFHGKMTMFIIDECESIAVRNLHSDFAQPTVAEMTIERLGEGYMDVAVHRDTRYSIARDKLSWIGPGWSFHEGPMQAYDPKRNATWRIDNVVARAASAEETSPGKVRFRFDRNPGEALEVGWTLQVRDGNRDQVGVFIHRSRDVRWQDVGIHFTHGLGIVGQFSADLSFRRLDMSPRPETGRTVAAFADFVHLSGCRGNIEIADSRFVGAHDDVINVHGTHLRIVGRPSERQLAVRFMHPQTYGFAAFAAGDEIEFVRAESLLPYGRGRVEAAELTGPREMLLTLEDRPPDGIGDADVIENVTWTPEAEIRGNYFARIPTRGVLATTRRPVVIADNVFERMRMSAVLVADDAASWYESGRAADLTVRGNRFIECGGTDQAVIAILPENEEIDETAPVHRHIRIADNVFETREALVLNAKTTRSLAFTGNTIRVPAGVAAEPEQAFRLIACSEVDIRNNRFESDLPSTE